jgi:hypothetical protein
VAVVCVDGVHGCCCGSHCCPAAQAGSVLHVSSCMHASEPRIWHHAVTCAVSCCAVLQVPGSLTSSMVDDVFFILKKSSSRALATQVRSLGLGLLQRLLTSATCYLASVHCLLFRGVQHHSKYGLVTLDVHAVMAACACMHCSDLAIGHACSGFATAHAQSHDAVKHVTHPASVTLCRVAEYTLCLCDPGPSE